MQLLAVVHLHAAVVRLPELVLLRAVPLAVTAGYVAEGRRGR